MRARGALLAVGVGLGLLACRAQEAPPPTGQVLYLRHCASCHGVEGTGAGPLAQSLRTPPTDLTRIAAQAGGRFDEARVMAVIDGRYEVAAHGPREMPVWGAVFEAELGGEPYGSYVGLLHSRALSDYLRSLQRR